MKSTNRNRLPVSVSAAVYITDEEGRILLLQQAAKEKGYRWGPTAGGMEPHETPIDTAIRETREEISVEIEVIDLVGVYSTDRGKLASGVGFAFRGKIVSGEVTPNPKEIKQAKFFTDEQISKLIEDNMLYKPEYNLASLKDFRNGLSFPLEIIRPMTDINNL